MVDIVHHTIIGIAGAGVAHAIGQDEAAVGFLIGSILPDLDIVFMALGKSRFLRMHQGVSHSLLGMPIIAAAVSAIMHFACGIPFLTLLIGTLIGMVVHVSIDLMNTFGVKVLWPSKRKFCLDAFFFVDVYVLAASTLFALATWFGDSPVLAAVVWWAFVLSYAGIRYWLSARARRAFDLTTAVPPGVMPFTWFVTQQLADIRVGTVSGIRPRLRWSDRIPTFGSEILDVLRGGPAFSDLEASLKMFRPVAVASGGDKVMVTSRCVAVPNFGNRYGETLSTIVDGRVVSENSRI